VMVLGAITVLTVFLTELQEETSSELSAALAERDQLRAEYYARSAVNLSRLLIASEGTIRASLGPMLGMLSGSPPAQIPVWNFSDMILGPFNDQLAVAAFGGTTGVDVSTGKNLGLTGGGRFDLKIIDEESKINVNIGATGATSVSSQLRLAGQLLGLFAPPQNNPLFEDRDADGQFSDRTTICGAIVDWTDFDETLFTCDISSTAGSGGGIEDNFYQTIGLDYRRKNSAFDSIEELRMVRGMGDDFWATFVDPEPGNPDKRTITVWGRSEAAVNVNTAPPQILLALVCGNNPEATLCTNEEQAMTFLSVLSLAKSFIPGGLLFPDKKDFYAAITQGSKPMIGGAIGGMLKSMGVEAVKIKGSKKDFLKTISSETKFLSIYADGVVPGNKRETRVRIHAVLDLQGAQPPAEGNQGGLVPPTGGGQGPGLTPGQVPEGAYEQQVRASAAGTVVYWRIE